jgi:hypothetical protein
VIALLVAALAAAPATQQAAKAQQARPRSLAADPAVAPQGRLVVLVVIDQLRYQDLLWLGPEFGPRGFAGLGRPAQLRYDTAVTETAADHAVLSTGAYAELNGIVANRIYDDGDHEAVDDPACPVWGTHVGRSAARLLVPTVGDAFKLGTNGRGRVVTVAVKDRTALFLAGASADLALWLDAETGRMTSSECYAKEPPAWLAQHWLEHPLSEFQDYVWTQLSPEIEGHYVPDAETKGAVPGHGIGPVFPHKIGNGKADKQLTEALRQTPAGTTIALRAAQAAVDNLRLGENGTVDLLAVGISAVDAVGHQFGSTARERVDTVLRTHAEVSAFLDALRKRLGPRLAIVLTADHGVTPLATDERRLRVAVGGTVDIDAVTSRVNDALDRALGKRQEGWVGTIDGSTLSLRRPRSARAIALAAEVLRKEPGLWKAVTAEEMAAQIPALRHAFFPGRSGDVLLVPRPLWTLKKAKYGADHGSPWNDDALVPFAVQAPGFHLRNDGRVFDATVVAPTIAALLDTAPPAAALSDPAVVRDQ